MLDYIKKLITPDMVSFWLPSGQSRAMDLIRGNHGQCYGTHPNVPVISKPTKETLVDGGLELWTSATDLTNWTESVSGTSTVNRESTEKVEGDYSCRFDVDASNSDIRIGQYFSIVPQKKHKIVVRYKNSLAGKTTKFFLRDVGVNKYLQSDGTWGATPYIVLDNSTIWKHFILEFQAHESYSDYEMYVVNYLAASSSIYFDDISVKEYKPAVIDPTLGWHFDGVDDYVDCGTDKSLDLTIEATFAFWAKTAQGAIAFFFSKHEENVSGYECHLVANGKLKFLIHHGNPTYTALDTQGTVNDGKWHHIVCRFDNGAMKVFIDGEQDSGTATAPVSSILVSTENLHLGRRSPTQIYLLDGYIALPFIANTAWSLQQVENFYNQTKGMFYPR